MTSSLRIIAVLSTLSGILLSSCNSGDSSEQPADDLAVIKFEEISDDFRLTDSFRDISCIQLEMTENSILGRIKRILDVDGELVVLTKDFDICVFSKEDGRFLRQIGSLGEGPEEFLSAEDICYDAQSRTILVMDCLKQDFVVYRLSGEFVERQKTKGMFPDSYSVVRDSGGTMLTCNNLNSGTTDECAFTIINPDWTMEDVDPFAPVTLAGVGGSSLTKVWAKTPMSACGDEIKFVKVLTDTLCSVKDGKASPLYKLDFGRGILTKETVKDMGTWNYEVSMYCLSNNLFTSVDRMYETSRFVIILPFYDHLLGHYWIDKETGEGFHFGSTQYYDPEVEKAVQGKSIIQIAGANEKEIISSFEVPLNCNSFKKAFDNADGGIALPDKVVTAIENVNPEGNPFLIIYEH